MVTTALRPTRYSDRENSTFFAVSDSLVSIRYTLADRKRYLMLPTSSLARLEARVNDGAYTTTHSYEIPRNRRVGDEIASVERGLYGFMDDVIRGVVQLRALEDTQRQVEALESEHLYRIAPRQVDESEGPGAGDESRPADQSALAELSERIVTAVRHLTNVTSLTQEGLDAYQRERAATFDRLFQSASPAAALQTRDVLQALEAFLRYDASPQDDTEKLRAKALEYLAYLRQRAGGRSPTLSEEQLEVILNDFVPACMGMRRRYDKAVSLPADIGGHVIGSFFGGGFAGWFSISLFGEALIRNVAGISLDLPGWWIGAGTAFAWPYLVAAFGLMTRERQYERGREALFKRMKVRLGLEWPERPSLPPPGRAE